MVRNGGAIAGATAALLSIANAQASDDGAYGVLVSNPAGTAASNPAGSEGERAAPPQPIPLPCGRPDS